MVGWARRRPIRGHRRVEISGLGVASGWVETGTLWHMSDYVIPEPEPKPVDETLSMELQILASNAVLRGRPSGEEKCANCRYYLDETADLSYCWHPKIRILVGDNWWCQWWEEIPAEESVAAS
jgi:hypothetical protein